MIGPGSKPAHYEVVSAVGRGGMGEVWKARDTKLGREVAIKTLPAEFAEDRDRLARFEREAKVLASLNHPHIAAIYGLEEHEGSLFLVLELVGGDTLADRLKGGAIPVEQALELGLQIAEALEAAHERGVIHRDLKPGNIKITPEGRVKVLDFGLAKALSGGEADQNLSNSPTLSMQATRQGLILGTAAYMAPEQARGKSADRRADVWAFGCVLYEMLTGRQAFRGEEVSDILAAVLALEPDYGGLPAGFNPGIEDLIRRCLDKDPRNRWQAVGDLRLEIARLLEDPSGLRRAPVPGTATGPRLAIPLGAAVVLTAVVVGFGVRALQPELPSPPAARFVISGATDEPLISIQNYAALAISPDGETVAYRIGTNDVTDIYVRRIGEATGRNLDAVSSQGVILGAFSPDGDWIAYFSVEDSELRRIPVVGGPSIRITELDSVLARGATWGEDDRIIFADDATRALVEVPAGGGEPTALTTPEEGRWHLWPHLLPGGRRVLFAIGTLGTDPAEWEIAVFDRDTGEQTTLIQGGTRPRYVATGYIVYGAEGALRAVAFDPETLKVSGTPAPVVEDVASSRVTGKFDYDISANGTLLYASGVGAEEAEATRRLLMWVDREGNEEAVGADPRGYEYLRISHDGRRVAVDEANQGGDIWVWTFASENGVRLTTEDGPEFYPVWSEADDRIAFAAESLRTVFWKASSNTGAIEALTPEVGVGLQRVTPYFFTPGDAALVFRDQNVSQAGDNVGMIALDGGEDVEPVWLLDTEFEERNAELSPDGNWMAYQSDESGRFEVYVRPFPNVEEDLFTISTAGGTKPVWGPNGDELFYLQPGDPQRMMVVAVTTGETFGHQLPESLIDWPYDRGNEGRTFDIAPDGTRFLTTKAVADETGEEDEPAPEPQVRIVLNWFQELKERVPSP